MYPPFFTPPPPAPLGAHSLIQNAFPPQNPSKGRCQKHPEGGMRFCVVFGPHTIFRLSISSPHFFGIPSPPFFSKKFWHPSPLPKKVKNRVGAGIFVRSEPFFWKSFDPPPKKKIKNSQVHLHHPFSSQSSPPSNFLCLLSAPTPKKNPRLVYIPQNYRMWSLPPHFSQPSPPRGIFGTFPKNVKKLKITKSSKGKTLKFGHRSSLKLFIQIICHYLGPDRSGQRSCVTLRINVIDLISY